MPKFCNNRNEIDKKTFQKRFIRYLIHFHHYKILTLVSYVSFFTKGTRKTTSVVIWKKVYLLLLTIFGKNIQNKVKQNNNPKILKAHESLMAGFNQNLKWCYRIKYSRNLLKNTSVLFRYIFFYYLAVTTWLCISQ